MMELQSHTVTFIEAISIILFKLEFIPFYLVTLLPMLPFHYFQALFMKLYLIKTMLLYLHVIN